jgi:hypothetical protein
MANSAEAIGVTGPEREPAYLLKTSAMRRRLMEAMERQEGLSFEDVCEKLGIDAGAGE